MSNNNEKDRKAQPPKEAPTVKETTEHSPARVYQNPTARMLNRTFKIFLAIILCFVAIMIVWTFVSYMEQSGFFTSILYTIAETSSMIFSTSTFFVCLSPFVLRIAAEIIELIDDRTNS